MFNEQRSKENTQQGRPDEENLSDSLLGVLRSSRSTRNMEEQRLEKMLQEMMDEKVKQLVAETNIPQLIQKHASKGARGFEVNISKYAQQWNMKVTSSDYNITLTRSWMDFLHTLHRTLNNEELNTRILATCNRKIHNTRCGQNLSLGEVGNLRSEWRCSNVAHKALPQTTPLYIMDLKGCANVKSTREIGT